MRLVVIGGVAAGMSAAARARRTDRSLEITVLEKGNAVSYGACGLPYYLEGRVPSLEALVSYPAEHFRQERDIDVRTGSQAVAIRHPERKVILENGERVPYDRLVLATGAKPHPGLIAGGAAPHVFTLQTLDDARRIQQFLEARKPAAAAIVGAGYIGLEVAEVLRAAGVGQVTVFEASANVLGRQDHELTDLVRRQLERFRIELRAETRIAPLDDVRADMVVVAAGFRPSVKLAEDAGIELGRTGAIRVTDRMETNLHGVYAAGDCTETQHLVTGRPVWLPLGTTANKTGRVAGANAAGARERFPGVCGTSIVRVCGLSIGLTGLSECQAHKEGFDAVSARIQGLDKPGYFDGRPVSIQLVADRRSRRLLGACITAEAGIWGDPGVSGRTGIAATAIARGMCVDEMEHLDLPYAPPFAPVWDPMLIAARETAKLLD